MRRSASGSIVIASFLSPVLTMRSIRSEEHTSELQSQSNLVCRLLLEKKKNKTHHYQLPLDHAHACLVHPCDLARDEPTVPYPATHYQTFSGIRHPCLRRRTLALDDIV